MVGVRTERLELDEAWSYVAKKQKNVERHEINAKGDQYVFIAMAGTQKAIISWGVGKRHDGKHDGFRARLTPEGYRPTRDQHRWLPSLPRSDPRRLQRPRIAWRDR